MFGKNSVGRLTAAVFGVLATAASAVHADQDVLNRLDVAERQGMLTQRMVKSACFAARGIGADLHLDYLAEAHDQFETSLLALREGSGMLQLLPETKPSLLMAQRRVMDAWPEMDRPIKAIIRDRTTSTETILELQPISLAIKAIAEDAAQRTAMAYSDDASGASFTQNMTVDIAARQRTLTQNMVKQACLMGISDDLSTLTADLAEAINLFDLSLNALQNGLPDAGVMAPPTDEIAKGLSLVKTEWTALKPAFQAAVEGDVPEAERLIVMDHAAEKMLEIMDEVVSLYSGI
ncbi:type IV pili methyl-accepting chemotaxis transducer N-terminal domain-containing protein [Pseudaestuariivita rosea]|uniref:type IV pili methyl-accepting chemotaxis transducer N-terminal domain-containing protein n=1 Tax=Pseudaestuariivita rosea TaxID=2763263 RepID=UPI001ABB59E2|nr:type IV pili methyl-accepting chemotaxis transducer N-terminal domain-containing protein [Pseudaestuariivita rosea]